MTALTLFPKQLIEHFLCMIYKKMDGFNSEDNFFCMLMNKWLKYKAIKCKSRII